MGGAGRGMETVSSDPHEATSIAMAEVTSAVIATSLVLISVFIPVSFFPGTTGILYKQFSLTIAKTPEEAEKRYMASGLVAHRTSLAYTGRDLSKQVVANLVGSPDLIREKVEGLRKIGVDHACALMIPADSMAEFEDQVEWFAKTVL